MDIILLLLIISFGVFCAHKFREFTADSIQKLRDGRNDSAGVLIIEYLDIIDNIDCIEDSIQRKQKLVRKMRQYQEQLNNVDNENISVMLSSFRMKQLSKQYHKILKKS